MSETDRLAGVTSWRFDENSNLRHLTDAENQSPYKPTAWTYDARNLKLTEALPGHNPASQIGDADYDKKEFAYDLAGRVDVATDQKGNNVTHLYDLASRLLQRDYRLFNQTAISDSDAFTYGDAGHMASAESGRYNNTVAFDYDAAGRLTSESLTVTFGQTTTYTVQSGYDAANRRTGITYPDGSTIARQYTDRDQLAQIDYNSAMVATFAYDNGLRRTSRTLGDTPGTQTTWTYGRQDNLPTAIGSDVAGASFSYTYDANKNKLTEGISAPMASFGFNSTAYDQADRLTAWNRTDGNLDQAWNLSLVGDWATFTENQVQQARTHTAVHEIAAIDSNPIAHDPTGNLARNAGDTLDRYTWDFDNRLAAADVDQDGTAECGYQYDALGRRVSKTVPDGEGSATTVFVGTIQEIEHSPHAMQVVAEYAADAAPTSPERKFVYATYIDEPVMMVDETALGSTGAGSEEPYYYHQNSLYSVAAVTDTTGTVVERYAYSAYGKPMFLDANANLLDPQASTIGNPYLFTGRRLDEETGLYYYRARMYDSELGRFVSRDPIGYEAGDVSLYRYVGNRPTNEADPSGLWPGGEAGGGAMIPGRPGTFFPVRPGAPPVGLPNPYGPGTFWPYPTPNPHGPGTLPNLPTMPTPPHPCAGYNAFIGSKCTLNDECQTEITDPYPAQAKKVCEGFMDLYSYAPTAVCVAHCLSSYEKTITNSTICSVRNTKRLNAHIYCYAVCVFIPNKGMPPGAGDVGWGMLLPDWLGHGGGLW